MQPGEESVAFRLAKPRRAGASWSRARGRTFVALLAPALIVLFIVTIVPTVFLLATSVTPLNLAKLASLRFVGMENFQGLIDDGRFWNSLAVQARLSFFDVTLQLLIGLGLALLLNARLRFLDLIRSAFIIPMVLPPVVVALNWKLFFTPNVSVLNWLLGLVHLPQPVWLMDANLALWAIIISDVWEWTPFVLLMVLAALQMMPEEPLEAAKIDGASGLQVFRYITLPLLRPVLLVAGLFRFIDSVKAFPQIYIMTGGGPGNVTEATNFYAFLEGFSYSYIGYSSAIIVVMLVVTFVLSATIIRTVGQEAEVE
ncbi:MAG: sugar ABC transporter permease [Chloroflexi bacterium]|nr:sugar ABC transporter permease [Chloroflexota bacterium]MCL5109119.1 sugar ABC transporter permease [Chloroflexota bacterium]